MNNVRAIRGLALTGLASLGLLASNANAQSLPVDVDITIGGGGITILNYYSAIDVTIDSADLAALQDSSFCAPTAGISECSSGTAVASTADNTGGLAGGDLDGNVPALTLAAASNDLSAVTLDLDNVWAVRAIGGTSANTTVGVVVGGDTTLSNGGSNSIEITGAGVYTAASTTPAATKTFADPGLVTPRFGGVQLTLDFSNADLGGTYSTSAGSDDNYLIGVTGT